MDAASASRRDAGTSTSSVKEAGLAGGTGDADKSVRTPFYRVIGEPSDPTYVTVNP